MKRLLHLVSVLMASAALAAADAPKPNVIFILCDDLGYGDVGVFFQNLRHTNNNHAEPWHMTPKLDTMAAEGIQLRGHYCPAPVCAPSRASLITGVSQGHANVRDNQFDKALENNHTLGSVLKEAGYKTALIGKWGLQGSGTSPATWPAYPTKRGFDYFYGYVRHADGHEHYPKEGVNPSKGPKEVWDMDSEVSSDLDKCYTADLWTARAKKWIVDQKTAEPAKPFFLYLAFDTPHATIQLPTQAYPAGGGLNGGLQWTGTPGAMITTASGTVDSWIHPDYAIATYDADKNPATAEVAWPNVSKRYATSVRRIDDCVGDLIQTLKDLQVDDNTLIVFTTDNGISDESYLSQALDPQFFNSFGPFDGIKRDCWEGGIRVGALVRWPAGIPANRSNEAPSQFQDWLPTLAELAGVPAPARADGVSLVPTLSGTGTQKPSQVYVEYAVSGNTPSYAEFQSVKRNRARGQMQAIRVGDLVGVRYNIQSHADPFEIYDVANDPQQLNNLAPSQTALQQQMKDSVLRMRRPDAATPRPYDSEPMPPLGPGPVVPGVVWSAYTREFPWVAKLDTLTPSATGEAARPDVSVRPQDQNVGLLFSGYLQAPADGDYTFYLNSDSGALLRIHEATVIDEDFGYTGGTEKSGVIKLKAGRHPFRIYYKHGNIGIPAMSLQWSGPAIAKQAVPASVFFRDGISPPVPPTAVDDSATTLKGVSVLVPVLGNDTDDGTPQPLSIVQVGSPHQGTAVVNGNGIVYTPKADFLGRDSFTYTISDGENTAKANVGVEVYFQGTDRWYPLNQVAGLTTEEAGGGRFAALAGFTNDPAQWIAGRSGRALQFDGVDDYVAVSGFNGVTGTAARTVSAWIKTTATGGTDKPIVNWGTNATSNKWDFLMNAAGRLRLEATGGWVVGTRLLNDGQWHHVACTFTNDGTPTVTDVLLYVDGTLETISSSQTVAIATTGTVEAKIGSDTQARFWSGAIQDVRIHASALSAQEIAAIHAIVSSRGAAWQRRYYGSTPVPWSADTDGDGLNALQEYAFGCQPQVKDSQSKPALLSGTEARSLGFLRREAATSELLYQVEASEDLSTWNLPVNLLETVPQPAGMARVSYAVPDAPSRPKLFYRVRVELP